MSEWSKERDWKSRIRQRIVGSNPTRSARMVSVNLQPTVLENEQRARLMSALVEAISQNLVIKFDPEGLFAGTVGPFAYVFEGEDDLLHLAVRRQDQGCLTPEEAQEVGLFLMPNLPWALAWIKPGQFSQHFYLGHDHLLEAEKGAPTKGCEGSAEPKVLPVERAD